MQANKGGRLKPKLQLSVMRDPCLQVQNQTLAISQQMARVRAYVAKCLQLILLPPETSPNELVFQKTYTHKDREQARVLWKPERRGASLRKLRTNPMNNKVSVKQGALELGFPNKEGQVKRC